MRRTFSFAIAAILLSFLLLLTTVNFTPREKEVVNFSTTSRSSGQLVFSMPSEIYAGDQGEISVQLKMDDQTPQSTEFVEMNLETAFEEMTPVGSVHVGLQQAESAIFSWSFRTYHQGDYPGTFWVWIDGGDGRELVLAKEIRLLSRYYLGGKVLHFRLAYGILGLMGIIWLIIDVLRIRKHPVDELEESNT